MKVLRSMEQNIDEENEEEIIVSETTGGLLGKSIAYQAERKVEEKQLANWSTQEYISSEYELNVVF